MNEAPADPASKSPANQTGPAEGSVKQRSGHEPKGKDLPRGSEVETRNSSNNRS